MATKERADIPLPSQQPPSVDFLEHRLSGYRGSHGRLPCFYDVDKKGFVEREAVQPLVLLDSVDLVDNEEAMAAATARFLNAVEMLKKDRPEDIYAANFDLSKANNWEGVLDEVRKAQESYLRVDNISQKVRNVFRKIGDNGKSIKPFIDLLPDGNYKTLCGGLHLILGGMIRNAEIRTQIADLLDELPDQITMSAHYSHLYSGSRRLRRCIQELYIAILLALEDIVRWYTLPSAKRAVKGLWKGPDYKQSLERRIEDIRSSKVFFQEEITKLLHARVACVDLTASSTRQRTEYVAMLSERTQTDVTDIRIDVSETRSGVSEVRIDVEDMKTKVKDVTRVVNGCNEVLGDLVKNAKWKGERDELRQQMQRVQQEAEAKDKTIQDLQAQLAKKSHTSRTLARGIGLNLKADAYTGDCQQVLRIGNGNTLKSQDRTRWVTEQAAFRQWLTSDESKLLTVNGNCHQERISPLSFLAALVVEQLREAQRVLVLPFFCGLHTSIQFEDSDEATEVLTMSRCVLAHMLSPQNIDGARRKISDNHLSFVGVGEVEELAGGSVSQYMKTLTGLLESLRREYSVIFLILDGVDYHDAKWPREVRRWLKRMVKSAVIEGPSEGKAVLKILLTASTRTHLSFVESKVFPKIEMPVEVDGERSGFHRIMWERSKEGADLRKFDTEEE